MTQASASSIRKRVGLGLSGSYGLPSMQPVALNRQAARRGAPLALVPALSGRRREENRQNIGLVPELRCECAIPNCRETFPAMADNHRGTRDRYIVAPAHFNGGTPVKVADRFFVI